MLNSAVMLWEHFDHTRSEKGFKRCGLDNALDGSEDYLIDRAAKEFWDELAMRDKLNLVKCDVEAQIESLGGPGQVRPVDVFTVIQDYDGIEGGIGVMHEGQECEAALKDGECVLEDDMETHEDCCSDEDTSNAQTTSCDVQPAGLCTTASDQEHLSLQYSDLQTMDVLITIAQRMTDPAMAGMIKRRKAHHLRQARHQDPILAGIAFQHRQDHMSAIKELQNLAALEDSAKHQFKLLGKKVSQPEVFTKKTPLLKLSQPVPPPVHSPPSTAMAPQQVLPVADGLSDSMMVAVEPLSATLAEASQLELKQKVTRDAATQRKKLWHTLARRIFEKGRRVLGRDDSLLHDHMTVYVVNHWSYDFHSPLQQIDYFHGYVDQDMIAQMADFAETNVCASAMIHPHQRVARLICSMQKLFRQMRILRQITDR